MKKNSVYTPRRVEQIRDLYGSLLDISNFEGKIRIHLNRLAECLYAGMQTGQEAALVEINNYHPDYLGIPIDRLKNLDLSLETAQQTIVSEYGFKDTKFLSAYEEEYDPLFEEALFMILQGDLPALEKQLTAHPDLLFARSNYGHRATLLHYTANNGVEIWRQVVPKNLPAIAQLLIKRGADKNARMFVYGGEHTPFDLAATSAHHYDAGIAKELLTVLG